MLLAQLPSPAGKQAWSCPTPEEHKLGGRGGGSWAEGRGPRGARAQSAGSERTGGQEERFKTATVLNSSWAYANFIYS